MAQYQALPQPQFAPPLQPLCTLQQAQVISNTYPQIISAQPLPHIPFVPQSQASPGIYQQQPPGPTWDGPPPYSVPQAYHTSVNSYQPPMPTQYLPLPPIATSRNNYTYHQQDPQSAYPANPPTQERNAYPPEYVRAPVSFAPTSYTQSISYGVVQLQNSHPIAPSPSLHGSGNPASLTPLDTAASIKAVVQIIGCVLSYLRDIKGYWGDCKNLISELTSTRGILDTLLDTFESMKGPGEWVRTIQALGEQLGPLVSLRKTVANLLGPLLRGASAPSYVKFTKSLPWPFAFEEMKNVLTSIQNEKSLLLLAVQNDVLFWGGIYLKIAQDFRGGGGDGAPQPPAVGPQTSTLQSEPNVDNLTCLFSQASLDTNPAVTTVVQRLDPTPQDRVEQVIGDVLIQDLAIVQTNDMIYSNHPCFHRSREFARKWSLPPAAIDNHIKLACGNRRYPVLMLLNPSPDHDNHNLSFDKMVQRCKTLEWIQRVLTEIGLTLAEVIILDICPLLSDRCMESMDAYARIYAMNEAFDITWGMLRMIRPNIVVSCQCMTARGEKWACVRHEISSKLCSSTRLARQGDVVKTDIEGHPIHVVQGYHPSGFLNFPDHHDQSGESLRRLLFRIYSPCVRGRIPQVYR